MEFKDIKDEELLKMYSEVQNRIREERKTEGVAGARASRLIAENMKRKSEIEQEMKKRGLTIDRENEDKENKEEQYMKEIEQEYLNSDQKETYDESKWSNEVKQKQEELKKLSMQLRRGADDKNLKSKLKRCKIELEIAKKKLEEKQKETINNYDDLGYEEEEQEEIEELEQEEIVDDYDDLGDDEEEIDDSNDFSYEDIINKSMEQSEREEEQEEIVDDYDDLGDDEEEIDDSNDLSYEDIINKSMKQSEREEVEFNNDITFEELKEFFKNQETPQSEKKEQSEEKNEEELVEEENEVENDDNHPMPVKKESIIKSAVNKLKMVPKKVVAGIIAAVAAIGAVVGIVPKKKQKTMPEETKTSSHAVKSPNEQKNAFLESMKVLDDQTINQDATIEVDNWQEVLTDLKLGTTVELDDGIKYSENSQGQGKQGKIEAVPWRQAGEYEINGVAILNDENEIVTYKYDEPDLSINEFAKDMTKDEKLVFHIAQIEGDTKNDTGWVKSDVVLKKLMEKNKEQNRIEPKNKAQQDRIWNHNEER